MAKDVITRFKLETTAFDSKIKQAAKGLSDYAKTATNAGNDFDKFTKSNVEAARALGTMATSSNNTKGKLQELVGAYNEMAKTYEHLTKTQQQSDFGKAMAESLTILQQRIKDTKQELYSFGEAADEVKSKSSGLFGDSGFTGMLAVTGGNLLASGIQKLGAEMADTIQQSVELARQGEGIRLAFERLNQPGLLDNLKEATHGTVSELELMKQAVKFDDFNLPVEQLGTLLAFAQKKAKDTGQSVDYMVDSIVTGLGRKSLMILDNLGLSASEIKEKMKETGDMTKAVAAIIKEQMGEAGEYVETAADRAARAAADATNEMERLGREAQPFAEEWAKAWNEIKIGGMQLLTTIFGPLAESARQIRSILNGGGFKFKVGIPNLSDGPAPSPTRQPGTDHKVQAPGGYVEVTDKNTGLVIGGQHFDNLQDANSINTWKKSLFKTGGGGGTNTPTYQSGSLAAQQAEVQRLTKLWQESGETVRDQYLQPLVDAEKKLQQMKDEMSMQKDMAMGKYSGQGAEDFRESMRDAKGVSTFSEDTKTPLLLDEKAMKVITDQIKEITKPTRKAEVSMTQQLGAIAGGMTNVVGGIENLGIEIPQGLKSILGGMQSLLSIVSGIATIVAAIQTIQTASLFKFAGGGVVHAAVGFSGIVPGNTYSNDQIPALLNAGEVVLNRAQAGVIANALEGAGLSNLQLETRVDAEELIIMLNNNGLRRGLGRLIDG